MGRLAKYAGNLKITVDGIELSLDMKTEEIGQFIGFAEKKDYPELVKLIRGILLRSVTEDEKTEVNGFIQRKFVDIFSELSIELGFSTREKMEKTKQDFQVPANPAQP